MNHNWTLEFVSPLAVKEIKKLPPELQADFLHIAELLMEFGPDNAGLPHTRPVQGKLWEMRLKSRENIARSIYYLGSSKKIVILHSFIKKTQKTPVGAIKIAKTRLKESVHDQI